MTVTLHAAASPGEVRVAAVRDGALVDFALWRPGAPDGVGDLHRGRVIAAVPAMAGAFVALVDAEGFLPDSQGGKSLTAGTMLGVRVTRAAQGGKGPRLTARLTPDESVLTAAGPVALLRRGPDPLTRLAEQYEQALVSADDRALVAALRPALGDRVRFDPGPLDEDVAAAIEALFEPVVPLPNGASLSIWPTPALVAIDVDAGSGISGAGGRRTVHEALNRAVLPALAGQIRMRALSGAIVVDLAGLAKGKRADLGQDLARALAGDPLRPKFLGFTALGLAEIVRARVHPPLHELQAGPLAAGLAALKMAAAGIGVNPGAMPVLRAAPNVVSALRADPVALADLARRAGRDIELRSDPSLPSCAWVLEPCDG
jgi:Ribonuclease G/E